MDFISGVLDPRGLIAGHELTLIVQATLLMLVVLVPVYALIIFFAYYYRAGNTKAKYVPHWQHAKLDELIWWAIPFEIVLVLGALTWTSTHELDPRKPLSSEPPMVIEVIALEWKWLFIYPEAGVASLNEVALPVGKPVEFRITADAPMNSFWIPQLGGQIYAMTGMQTSLNLQADESGEYKGLSANYSGEGFAHMKFTAKALSESDFENWLMRARTSSRVLLYRDYLKLSQPATSSVVYFSEVDQNLFEEVLQTFNHAGKTHH